jgi:rare lipoprotein A
MPTRKPQSKYLPASLLRIGLACVIAMGLGACSSSSNHKQSSRYSQAQDTAPAQHIDMSAVKDAIPRVEPYSRYGNPPSYVVLGKRYHTLGSSDNYHERGIASWYGTKFHGHRTSSGESYDMYKMSAAHKSLPLPTYARVTNLGNGKSVVVKVNDRGPFHENPGKLRITEAVSNQQPIYRLRAGPLASVETADQLTKILATQGIESPRVVID